jgi:four helix bundle protein
MEHHKGFRGLLVWRQAMMLAKGCYALTQTFPREERYGLTQQIRRAAISIPANIAEGNGRKTRKDYVSFLRIAQGSLRELQTYLLFVVEVNLTTQAAIAPHLLQLESVARLLNRLIQALHSPHPPLTP